MMRKKMDDPIILVRGAGELATGVGWTFAKAGYRILMTEVAEPLMVRWPVCFGYAVNRGNCKVEGVQAKLVNDIEECFDSWEKGEIPIVVDPFLEKVLNLKPAALIDGIMAKKNMGTNREMAPLTIGLGPGFSAGEDVHLVIETNRGHDLARLIYSGPAEPNTGIPGEIGGVAAERVIYSPQAGTFRAKGTIGDLVNPGDVLGEMIGKEEIMQVKAPINGVLRGLILDGTYVKEKVKIGDVDPRAKKNYCWTISEKARAIGAAALLAFVSWNEEKN